MNAPTNSPPTAKSIGDAAEKIAADFLSKRGLRLVESNYRCRFGEIDLVMRDGDSLVFVEVRRRENSQMAAESISAVKRRRLNAAARHYLAKRRVNCPCRFDAVLVSDSAEWLRNIF